MSEAMSEHSAEPRRRLRLVTEVDEILVDEHSDDEITQVMETHEFPDDLMMRERDRLSATLGNQLRVAFEGFEIGADKLTSSYDVTGFVMPKGSEKVYELSIEGQGGHRNDAPATIAIGVASEDGSPDWKIDGPEIDARFEAALVELMEATIAKVRRI